MPVMHKPQFLHYRFFDHDGNSLPNGGVTVSYTPLKDGTVIVGISYCSPKDRYAKISGRGKSISANNRTNKRKTYAKKMSYNQLIARANSMISKKIKELQHRHPHWNIKDGHYLSLVGK